MASLVNQHSLLRFGLLGAGVWYGITRKASLTEFVKERSILQKQKEYEDLVEEGKLMYDSAKMAEYAKEATKAGVASIDPNSWKFDADAASAWASSR